MRQIILSALVIPLSILFASQAFCQDERGDDYDKPLETTPEVRVKDSSGNVIIPPGMEIKKIGGLNLVVPEGAQMHKERSQWVIEGAEDFAIRNISEIKTRLTVIEKEQKELKKSIEDLKESLRAPIDKPNS